MWDTILEYLDWRLLTVVALVAWIVLRGHFKRMHTKRVEMSDEEYEQQERIREAMEERRRSRHGR